MSDKCGRCGEDKYTFFLTPKCRHYKICYDCYVSRFRKGEDCKENCGHCDKYLSDRKDREIDLNSEGH